VLFACLNVIVTYSVKRSLLNLSFNLFIGLGWSEKIDSVHDWYRFRTTLRRNKIPHICPPYLKMLPHYLFWQCTHGMISFNNIRQ